MLYALTVGVVYQTIQSCYSHTCPVLCVLFFRGNTSFVQKVASQKFSEWSNTIRNLGNNENPSYYALKKDGAVKAMKTANKSNRYKK